MGLGPLNLLESGRVWILRDSQFGGILGASKMGVKSSSIKKMCFKKICEITIPTHPISLFFPGNCALCSEHFVYECEMNRPGCSWIPKTLTLRWWLKHPNWKIWVKLGGYLSQVPEKYKFQKKNLLETTESSLVIISVTSEICFLLMLQVLEIPANLDHPRWKLGKG